MVFWSYDWLKMMDETKLARLNRASKNLIALSQALVNQEADRNACKIFRKPYNY